MTLNTVYGFSRVTLTVMPAFEFRSRDGRPFRNRPLRERPVRRERAGCPPKS